MIQFNHAKGNYKLFVNSMISFNPFFEPALNFSVSSRDEGSTIPLTYLQVHKLRNELNGWLSQNFGKGQFPWEGSINDTP